VDLKGRRRPQVRPDRPFGGGLRPLRDVALFERLKPRNLYLQMNEKAPPDNASGGALNVSRESLKTTRVSADFHISEFTRDVWRNIRPTDHDPGRQALFLVPPATPLGLAQESQMLSIRENAHGDLRT
jgi:hypothetical protein